MQTVLTIAGFDPSSGAGVTADLMVFAAHSLFGTSAITALTVQSTVGVRSVHPVAGEILTATLDCLQLDLPPAGIKIGMLATAPNVRAVADYLGGLRRSNPHIPVVLDPIIRSSSGRELLDAEGVTFLREILLPYLNWITPNLDELRVWTGKQNLQREDIPEACHLLQRQVPSGTLGILATGGHLDPPDDYLLSPTGEDLWLPGTRIETRATHGTGCAFSSAFLSRLVLGDPPAEAARAAKQYVATALQTAIPRGTGHSSMNHLWPILNKQH
jgi:hydroxymethylpyrimidine/phosphomethylpyrimidine kinase